MGLFSSKKNGGILNVIRCDEDDYLVWKWRPSDMPSTRENAIRWGSTLHVKEGEVAVFVYKQNDGKQMDYFEGPLDTTLKTANFPVLSSIIGLAYGGDTPFQAEVYFINLAGNVKMPFFINQFDIFDPRYPDFPVPVTVKGSLMFNITDYKSFVKLHRMVQFSQEDMMDETKDAVKKRVKSYVSNLTYSEQIPAIQIERRVAEVSDLVEAKLKGEFADDFGVNIKRVDLSDIVIDKESEGYQDLYETTVMQTKILREAQTEDTTERMRMGREVEFKRQNLAAETDYFAAHRLNLQADVSKTAAESLGELGGSGIGGGDFNAAGMMAGMMLGGTVGAGMSNMMGGMMSGMQGQMQPPAMQTPPPIPQVNYHIAVNGQQAGPYEKSVIANMIQSGQLNSNTLVWKQGMPQWEPITNVPDFAPLFSNNMPPAL
ncbi:MAG: SPFH domain-containing protein [Bacteroidales bacterium]|nr:SPFH domain-containing protein [Bacteroidales bacterium]